jgi:hypothetical protein
MIKRKNTAEKIAKVREKKNTVKRRGNKIQNKIRFVSLRMGGMPEKTRLKTKTSVVLARGAPHGAVRDGYEIDEQGTGGEPIWLSTRSSH